MQKSIPQVNWDLPENVGAAYTTRAFGNVAAHVGDDPAAVVLRRRKLLRELKLAKPIWYLSQQHTAQVSSWPNIESPADAVVAHQAGAVCAVLTADCLPMLLCSEDGVHIAAVHAGWRGLAAGILANTVRKLRVNPAQLRLWVGPAICQQCFEVGDDVYDAFRAASGAGVDAHFVPSDDRWQADLSGLAASQAHKLGISAVTQSGLCTSCQQDSFYSYRKNKDTGRFASIIWRKS